MMKKSKEKKQEKNTKDNTSFNLDNEIIIGIKTLPDPKNIKNKKKSNNKKKNKKKQNTQNSKKNSNKKRTNKKQNEDEFELKLGIEDESVKKKINKKKKVKSRKPEDEKKKKKRKKVFCIIKWTTLLLLITGGTIYFLLSPYFNIKTITTSGNMKITNEELISLSGIKLEENTFKMNKQQVENLIKQNAYVDSVKIKRKSPNSIEIEIEERKPTYMLSFANAYVYINNQGYFLEVSKTKLELPIITGFLTPEEEIHAGNRLCTEDLQRLDNALQIMKTAESNEIGSLITKINIADKQNYILELQKEKKTVHIGDTTNLSTKMLYIKSILEQNKNVEGEIFVNTDLNNKGAIFRKKI